MKAFVMEYLDMFLDKFLGLCLNKPLKHFPWKNFWKSKKRFQKESIHKFSDEFIKEFQKQKNIGKKLFQKTFHATFCYKFFEIFSKKILVEFQKKKYLVEFHNQCPKKYFMFSKEGSLNDPVMEFLYDCLNTPPGKFLKLFCLKNGTQSVKY